MLAVASTEGPLISIQSLLLGIAGLVIFFLLISELAKKIDLVDINNEPRKDHVGAIPLVGGLGLYISYIYGAFVFGVSSFYIYVLASLVPIMFVGILDGIQGITVKPVYRIIAQIASCWIVISATDVYIQNLGDLFGFGPINIGALGIPFTIFSIVGICNAFNMLDGKDGLLGSVSIIIMTFLMLLLYFNNILYQFAQIVALSILIYLVFNLDFLGRRRKIFLGDHGSTSLGYIISWSLVYLSQETEFISPISAIWFVFLPLTDACFTFIRRYKSSHSIFLADRLHFHHILSDEGFSDMAILLIFSLITLLACMIAVTANLFQYSEYMLLYIYLSIFVSLLLVYGRFNDDK